MKLDRRQDLVHKVVSFIGEPADYYEEIHSFGRGCESELVTITVCTLRNMLDKYISGEIPADMFHEWTNFVEHRDDFGFENGKEKVLGGIVFWLAYPNLNWPLTSDLDSKIEEAMSCNAI